MSLKVNTEFREHLQKIVSVTDEEYAFIFAHFTTKTFKKHQFLVQEDQDVPNDFWVVKGLVKAYHSNEDGKESIMQFAMEGWWITDYQAYFKKTKATLNVCCLEDTQVLCLSLENREKICAEFHQIEHFFRKKSNAGYIALQRRILSLLNSSASERYEQFLIQYPTLIQRVPKTQIAAYLGVSRETLSRLSTS